MERAVTRSLMVGLALLAAACETPEEVVEQGPFTLTLLHNNEGESHVLPEAIEGEPYGGIARFVTMVKQLRDEADETVGERGVLTVSAGDHLVAGKEFTVSLERGVYYDAIAMDLVGYDVVGLGNHEFDFGADSLADVISETTLPVFVSSNLDFSAHEGLAALQADRRILGRTIVRTGGRRIGVVAVTTETLHSISSPDPVDFKRDADGELRPMVEVLQEQVDAHIANGVNKIIAISHLQHIEEDIALAQQVTGVDVWVAGGTDERLANVDSVLLPGDDPFDPTGLDGVDTEAICTTEGEETLCDTYPLWVTDAEGTEVPLVSGDGNFQYLGKLVVTFDEDGDLESIDEEASGPVRIAGGGAEDAVAEDVEAKNDIVTPITRYFGQFGSVSLGDLTVDLDGQKSSVRTQETNLGDLLADAILWKATQIAATYTTAIPTVAIQNAGGIRNDSVLYAADRNFTFTLGDSFDVAPFQDAIGLVGMTATQFEDLLEHVVSDLPEAEGKFAQLAGVCMSFDASLLPRSVSEETGVVTQGERIRSVTLMSSSGACDGEQLVVDGEVIPGGSALVVAMSTFLASGGDDYPIHSDATQLGAVTYRDALMDYIAADTLIGAAGGVSGLGGVIDETRYAPVEEPALGPRIQVLTPELPEDPG